MPLAEDHRREGDVTIARGDVIGEGQARSDGEECASQARQRRSEDRIAAARAVDVDADGVGGLGVLTTGPQPETLSDYPGVVTLREIIEDYQ